LVGQFVSNAWAGCIGARPFLHVFFTEVADL